MEEAGSGVADRQWFDDWVRKHRHWMLIVAERYCGPAKATTAEDIVQEALIVAWRNLPGLRTNDNAEAWVAGVIKNLGGQAARKRGRRQQLMRDYIVRNLDEFRHHDDSNEDHWSDQLHDVFQVAGTLPPRQQAVICGMAKGKTDDEIAQRLGVTRKTIRRHRQEALRRLKKALLPEKLAECRPDS